MDQPKTKHAFESAITIETAKIEAEIESCFDNKTPVDTMKILRLQELRVLRVKELAAKHSEAMLDRTIRIATMQQQTNALRDKLIFTPEQMSLGVAQLEHLYQELDKYDVAAMRWVKDENTSWPDSEAASILAGILIIADEIH